MSLRRGWRHLPRALRKDKTGGETESAASHELATAAAFPPNPSPLSEARGEDAAVLPFTWMQDLDRGCRIKTLREQRVIVNMFVILKRAKNAGLRMTKIASYGSKLEAFRFPLLHFRLPLEDFHAPFLPDSSCSQLRSLRVPSSQASFYL